MKSVTNRLLDGPIPGENYTSDTKNYPWHRAPDITDVDKAIEYLSEKILEEETSQGILTLIESGISVASVVDLLVTEGVAQGKWTVDFAILMAGPVAHILCLMCRAYGVEYNLGIGDKKRRPTKAMVKEFQKGPTPSETKVGDKLSGFLGMVNQSSKPVADENEMPMKPAATEMKGFI